MNGELTYMTELLGHYLCNEQPRDIAKVLSRLDSAVPRLLQKLPRGMHADVVFELFQVREGPHGLLRRTVDDLGGVEVVCQILNNSGAAKEREILIYLDDKDPHLAETIRNSMFSFEQIPRLPDKDLAHLWDRVDPDDMALALRGADETSTQRLLACMPEPYRDSVENSAAASGPVLLPAVKETQLRIVHQVRLLEQEGAVSIVRGDNGVHDHIL